MGELGAEGRRLGSYPLPVWSPWPQPHDLCGLVCLVLRFKVVVVVVVVIVVLIKVYRRAGVAHTPATSLGVLGRAELWNYVHECAPIKSKQLLLD